MGLHFLMMDFFRILILSYTYLYVSGYFYNEQETKLTIKMIGIALPLLANYLYKKKRTIY